MTKLTWQDADEIGYRLFQQFPDVDPMAVRFTDLHRFVISLEGFTGESTEGGESALEKIQMAWAEYFHEPRET